MNDQLRNRTDNAPNPPGSTPDRLTTDAISSACNPERISRLHASLEAIRQRIEKPYSLISNDLPEIGSELVSAFDQAGDALDDLCSGESGGSIGCMTGRLQAFLDSLEERVGIMRNSTMRSIERLHNARRLYSGTRAIPMAPSPESRPASYPGGAKHGSSLIAAADAMEKLLAESLDLQEHCLERIRRCAANEIPSLARPASSMAVILRDLASRSRAIKATLLRVMSSLQTQDIIDQDIAAVSDGLQEALSGTSHAGRRDGSLGVLCFLEQFSLLSHDLMTRIFSLIRTHVLNIEHDMDRIEESLHKFNEDMDALGGFFHSSGGETSFLVILWAETDEAIQDLEQLIGSLADHNVRLDAARFRLSRACAELEPGDAALAEGAMRDELARLVSVLESVASQAHPQAAGNSIQKIRAELSEAHEWLRGSVDGIRNLLNHALAGIHSPTARCLEAMGAFRREIRDLEGISGQAECVLEEMHNVACSIASIRKGLGDHPGRYEVCELPRELERIVERLRNPHSDLLAEEEKSCRKETDLTIF